MLTAALAPPEMAFGATFTVDGTAASGGAPSSGLGLQLEVSAYPYSAWQVAGAGQSGPDGSFRISAPHRTATSACGSSRRGSRTPRRPSCTPRSTPAWRWRRARSGRAGCGSARGSRTPLHVASPPVTARWYVAPRGSSTYRLGATTVTHELPGAVTYASAIVNPPARRFSWRVCVNPPWEAAMGPAAAHGPCPPHGFHLRAAQARHGPSARAAFEFGGEGRGTPLAPFPGRGRARRCAQLPRRRAPDAPPSPLSTAPGGSRGSTRASTSRRLASSR